MMPYARLTLAGLLLGLAAGCGETMTAPPAATDAPSPSGTETPAAPAEATPEPAPAPAAPAPETPAAGETAAAPAPVPIEGGKAQLTPANTSISFVGAHTDSSKADRVGGFEKFTGSLDVDPATKQVVGLSVGIDTTSIWTQFANLTNHLSSPDFFDTREYPKAEFTKATVTSAEGGKAQVKGSLTLHGTTREIEFPAQITASDAGVVLTADFTIDRTQFGMDKLTDGVKPEVKISVAVGTPTKPTTATGAP